MIPTSGKTAVLLLPLAAWTFLGVGRAPAAEDEAPLKVVVHVNFAETGAQGAGLRSVRSILEDEPNAQVEVVCHAAGIQLVEQARTSHPDAVASLIEQGVRFVACENTMRLNAIKKEDLIPGVGAVPSGALEVVRKQSREGYAYFKP